MVTIELDLTHALRTGVGRMALGDEAYEPEVAALLPWLFRDARRGIFIDIGSNIGYFPLLLAQYARLRGAELAIHAHEPLPALQEVSRRLQEANGLSYRLSSTALSDSSGTAQFFVSAVSDASNSLVQGFRRSKDVIAVETDTMDRAYTGILAEGGFDAVVLLIDVETAEPAVLRGARHVVQTFRPLIVCEVLANRTEKDLAELLAEFRYAAYRFEDGHWRREEVLFGDRTHKHRDWFFVPAERAEAFGATFAVPESTRVVATARR